MLTVAIGDSATFIAAPLAGYEVDQWLVNGAPAQLGGINVGGQGVGAPSPRVVHQCSGRGRPYSLEPAAPVRAVSLWKSYDRKRGGAIVTPPVFEFALFFVAPTMPAPFFALMNKPKVLVADPR